MRTLFLVIIAIVFSANLRSQATIGLLQYGNGDLPGYVLYNPINYTSTYLIDKCGYKVREWQSSYPSGLAAYLLPDGSMVRAGNIGSTTFNAGGKGGVIEKWGFNGNFIWSYQISSTTECQHHDIRALPNGNILAMVWEKKTAAQAIALGRDPAAVGANLWAEKIVEYQPVGVNGANVVWEWNVWDHLVQNFDNTKPGYDTVAEHPELIDFNYTNGTATVDWMHNNGLDYDSVHDQIIFSSRQLCEIYIIDHSTTTAEAASHTGGNYGKGGDILFRWGNPEAYGRGTLADRKLFFQHCPRWIPQGFPGAGRISVFNNGNNRPAGNYSSVDVIIPPTDANWNYTLTGTQAFGPDSAVWSYTDPVPANFYDLAISGAFRMPNGNFIVTDGMNGKIFEIDSNKTKLWEYQGTVNASGAATQGTSPSGTNIFKATFYDLNYSAFSGQTLTPGLPIEINPISYNCSMPMAGVDVEEVSEGIFVFPNPAIDLLTVKSNPEIFVSCKLYDVSGRVVLSNKNSGGNLNLDISRLGSGIYFLELSGDGKKGIKKIIKE